MGIIRLMEKNGARVGVWKIMETAEEMYESLQLDEREIEYLQSLTSQKRNLHWLGSRALIRKLINTAEFIELESQPNKKPVLKNFPYNLSISHSNDMAAVILSESHQVGIDIELIKDNVEVIVHKFLSDAELEKAPQENRTESLILAWCAKEALYKLDGEGRLRFRENLVLEDIASKGQGTLIGHIIRDSRNHQYAIHYEKVEDYMVAFVIGNEV